MPVSTCLAPEKLNQKKDQTRPAMGFSLLKSLVLALSLLAAFSSCFAFQSDELVVDDEEFGLEGGVRRSAPEPARTQSPPPQARKRFSDPDSDSKIQLQLEHAFGDSDFSSAGTFTARLKASNHGGQTLTKLRFSRNSFTTEEKDKFSALLQGDDFYRIRLPSNVLSPPGRDFVISSVKARCLPWDGLDEHIVIHMDGVNILAVNYGTPGECPYPRQLRLPSKWSFNSHATLKNSEQAPRAPIFTEEVLGGEGVEGEAVAPPERSFLAKYWMYMIPLGLVVMNAVTQAMNLPEEQAAGQGQLAAGQRAGPPSAARRR